MLQRYQFRGAQVADKKLVINIRVDPEVKSDLEKMADEHDRTTHNMIIVILKAAIEQWKREQAASTGGGDTH